MAQMKEQIKSPERELTDEEIDNLSDAEFKTLVIRMLTEMVEYGQKMEERMKAMQSEIKENVEGTNSEGKETGTQTNNLEQKEEINIQPEQNEETRIQKNEERALAGVAQWIECWPANQRVSGSIPSQGTCLGFGPGPQ